MDMKLNHIKLSKKMDNSKTEKREKETASNSTSYPVIDDSSLKKIGKKAKMLALAAMLTSAATSCQEVDIDGPDLEPIVAQLTILNAEVVRGNTENRDRLDAIILMLKNMGVDLSAVKNYLADLKEITNHVSVTVDGIKDDTSKIKGAILDLKKMCEDHFANDPIFLAKLNAIISGQGYTQASLEEIIKLINEQTSVLTGVGETIISVGDKITSQQAEQFNLWIEMYQAGLITLEDLLNNINDVLNSIDNKLGVISDQLSGISKQIVDLTKQLKSYQNASLYYLADIDMNTSNIDGKLDKIIRNQNEGLKIAIEMYKKMDEATAVLYQIRNRQVTKEDLQAILGDLYAQIEPYLENIQNNTANIDIDAVIKAIEDNKTDLTETNAYLAFIAETLKELGVELTPQLLEAISAKLDVIIRNGGADAEDIKELLQQAVSELVGIHGDTSELLEAVKALGGKMDVIVDQNNEKIRQGDKAIGYLASIDGKTITLSQLKNVLGDYYNEIKPYLEKIGANGNEIDLGDVIAAIKENKTDLTKTNALIQSLINVVQNLDFSGNTTYDPAALAQVISLLQQALTDGNQNAADLKALIEKANDLLGGIKDVGDESLAVLKALYNVAKDAKDGFDAAFSAYQQNTQAAMSLGRDILNAINTGNTNVAGLVADLKAYADKAEAAAAKAAEDRAKMQITLQAILEKEVGGNGGITIDELKEIMPPNYMDILQEISDKIGKVITSADLENFFLKTQPDLTKTNALIQSLINVVQNKDFGSAGGSADMSRVETLLGQLLDKQNPTPAQIQEVIDAINKILDQMSSETRTGSTSTLAYASAREEFKNRPDVLVMPEFYVGSHLYNSNIYNA